MSRTFWTGLALVIFSYFQLLVPDSWAQAHHFAAGGFFAFGLTCFVFGIILLSEGIVQKVGGVSLWSLASGGGPRKYLRFFAVAAVVGVFLELCAQWIGKLWFYPYYPTWFYWPSVIPSFVLYWVFIVESYMAGKALLDRWISKGGYFQRGRDGELQYYSFEPALYAVLGTAGSAIFMFGIFRAFFAYSIRGGYSFNVLSASSVAPAIHYIIWAFIGLWLVCEGVLYVNQKPSLMYSMLHGYFVPAIAIAGTAVLLALVWESQNVAVGFWQYQNWPWPNATMLGVQLSVIITWPANYIVYLLPAAALVPAWAPKLFARPASPHVRKGK